MNLECPKCKQGTVDYAPRHEMYAVCDECDSYFEVDPDADWNGDHYVDCSTISREMRRVCKAPDSESHDYTILGTDKKILVQGNLLIIDKAVRKFPPTYTETQALYDLGYFIV